MVGTPLVIVKKGEEGMEPDDLLCSRNARSEKDEKGSLVVLLLAERARVRLSGWLVFLVCLVLLDEFPVRPTRQTR